MKQRTRRTAEFVVCLVLIAMALLAVWGLYEGITWIFGHPKDVSDQTSARLST